MDKIFSRSVWGRGKRKDAYDGSNQLAKDREWKTTNKRRDHQLFKNNKALEENGVIMLKPVEKTRRIYPYDNGIAKMFGKEIIQKSWKKQLIRPVHKKGKKIMSENYNYMHILGEYCL